LKKKPIKEIISGRNLYLIGMMASGKSVTGPLLAKKIGYRFIDSDNVIEQVAKKKISKIFIEDGEKTFRNIEKKVLHEIGSNHSLVISTGGGIVTSSSNWGILHQGIVIWLDLTKGKIISRLKNDHLNRPMLEGGQNLETVVDKLLNERIPLYKEADLRVSVEDETPSDVAEKIIKMLPDILNS
tara:strand:+ start:2294 stop:2845 length:552 start_codon:yes stop_codon:yes gene_type:complete